METRTLAQSIIDNLQEYCGRGDFTALTSSYASPPRTFKLNTLQVPNWRPKALKVTTVISTPFSCLALLILFLGGEGQTHQVGTIGELVFQSAFLDIRPLLTTLNANENILTPHPKLGQHGLDCVHAYEEQFPFLQFQDAETWPSLDRTCTSFPG